MNSPNQGIETVRPLNDINAGGIAITGPREWNTVLSIRVRARKKLKKRYTNLADHEQHSLPRTRGCRDTCPPAAQLFSGNIHEMPARHQFAAVPRNI
jgi:hypothetical protein